MVGLDYQILPKLEKLLSVIKRDMIGPQQYGTPCELSNKNLLKNQLTISIEYFEILADITGVQKNHNSEFSGLGEFQKQAFGDFRNEIQQIKNDNEEKMRLADLLEYNDMPGSIQKFSHEYFQDIRIAYQRYQFFLNKKRKESV